MYKRLYMIGNPKCIHVTNVVLKKELIDIELFFDFVFHVRLYICYIVTANDLYDNQRGSTE